ncbi:MAG: S8 family serine peptidase [candidate division WOR-3 bacterium]
MFNLLLAFLFVARPVIPGKMTPELAQILHNTSDNEKILVIVHMATEYPYDQLRGMTPVEKCKVFENIALNSQREIVEYLKALPREIAEVGGQFWIFNGFHLKATKALIYELAKRDDIWFICHNGIVKLDAEVLPEADITGRAPEWNIKKIKADSCWAAGYSGSGIILGHIDTGVLTTHEALTGKWLSPYWIDGVSGQSTPYDDHGHGTHTMGTICGGDGPGPFVNDVGIAYGAHYIPTKAFDANGSGQYAWIDTCMQYLASLKSGGVDIRAIGNSWGSSGQTDLHWWDIILNWKNLDVFPVFSNGNSGPNSGTANAPGNYPTAIGVGATDSLDVIASFSSRGPAPNQSPWNDPQYWYYPTWNLLKPDVSAPGVAVRSSYNNGGYTSMQGTSMASPHVTGGTAILLEKNSNLTPNQLFEIFYTTCDQPSGGGPYPNNNYGWGRINLYRALQQTPPPTPHHNIRVQTIVVPGTREREYTIIQPQVRFKNAGTFDENNIPVVCQIKRGTTTVYTSNRTIGSLLQNKDTLITFDNFTVGSCGNHYTAFGIANLSTDTLHYDDTLKKNFVAARVYEVTTPDCDAWKIANADSGTPPAPTNPVWIPATATEKQQISALDNQWWVTAGSPQDTTHMDVQLYGFRLTGVPDTAIEEMTLEWWGHHGSGVRDQLRFRLWNTLTSSYSLKITQQNVTSDQLFSIIIPDDSAEAYVGNDGLLYACVANDVYIKSSCPLLFTHNKNKSYFVGDIVTGGDIGTWIGRVMGVNLYAPPDYDEYVKIDGDKLQAVNGKYYLSINEMLQEISYIDEVKLYAVDHPAENDIYPHEALLWPGYQGLKIFNGYEKPIYKAFNEKGQDITDYLNAIDRNFAPFELTGLVGFAKPFTITLDLGELNDPDNTVLCLYGSTRFPDAGKIKEVSDIYEAYKKGMKVQNPTVEVYNNGKWHKIKSCGMPAGHKKVVTYPLFDENGKSIFKSKDHKLRITFYHEVYLDKIWITTDTNNNYRVAELTPISADLHYYGSSAYVSDDGEYPGEFDYATKVQVDYAEAAGYYTRYGDVLTLLQEGDNKFVIMKSGDEIKLTFDAQELPPLPDGWKRDFIFATKGFYKAIRPGRAYAYSVDPLPFYGMRADLSANGVGYYPYDPAPGLFGSLIGRIYARIAWGYPFSLKDAITLIKNHITNKVNNKYPAELTEYCQLWNTRRVEGYYPAYYANFLPHKNLEKVPLTEREGKWPMHLASLGIPFGPHSLYSNYVRLWMVTHNPLVVVEEKPANQAKGFSFIVLQNPFRNTAKLEYNLPVNTKVNLSVYDNTGRLVRRLVDAKQDRGSYQLEWSGDDEQGRKLSTGVYFVRFETDQTSAVQKVIMLK